jgi:hypothetical protein
MIICPRCRWENADRARACLGCGVPLGGPGPAAAPLPDRTERIRTQPAGPTVRIRVPPPAPPRVVVPPSRAPSPPPTGPPCPACGLPVPAGRRFCRCGNALSRPEPPEPPSDTGAGAGVLCATAFRRAQRTANGGSPVRFDAGIGGRAVALRAFLLAVLAVVIGSQLGPWGPEVRAGLAAWITSVVPF